MLDTETNSLQLHSALKKDPLFQSYTNVLARCEQAQAIDAPDGTLSYGELDGWATKISLFLKPGQRVGIFVNPSIAFAALVVACMKSNCLAILLDPNLAIEEESEGLNLDLCFYSTDLKHRTQTLSSQRIDIDKLTKLPNDTSVVRTYSFEYPGLHQLITSGSSGKPTQAIIGRDAMWIHVQEMNQAYDYQPGEVHANLTRHTTAAGLHGFWRILLLGGCFLFVDLKQESFLQVYHRLQKAQVKTLQGIPSVLLAMTQACSSLPKLASVKQMIFGGEGTTPKILQEIAQFVQPDCQAAYNYSSTEAMQISVFKSTFKELMAFSKIPMGQALPSRQVLILDENQADLPRGQVGEIVVRSAYLALKITGPNQDQRLKVDPNDSRFKFYFTGDLGRWHPDGYLEHWGRKDRQIKLNGVRIDPSQIEAQLEKIPGIERAIVARLTNKDQAGLLCAFLLRDATQASDTMIYTQLTKSLSESWIPKRLFSIDHVPLLPTGKIDLNRLLSQLDDPHNSQTPQIHSPINHSETGLGQWLQKTWSDLLGLPINSKQASFRASGGDSLKALRLIAYLQRIGLPDMSPQWLIHNDSLESQIQALEPWVDQILKQSFDPSLSLSPVQNRNLHAQIPCVLEHEWVLKRIGWL